MSQSQPISGRLTVNVFRTRSLLSVQLIGKQDPYFRLRLDRLKEWKRSKTHSGGGHEARWDESFEFLLEGGEEKFLLEVWDAEALRDRQIAFAELPVDALVFNAAPTWYTLQSHKEPGKYAGDVLISTKFDGTGRPLSLDKLSPEEVKKQQEERMKKQVDEANASPASPAYEQVPDMAQPTIELNQQQLAEKREKEAREKADRDAAERAVQEAKQKADEAARARDAAELARQRAVEEEKRQAEEAERARQQAEVERAAKAKADEETRLRLEQERKDAAIMAAAAAAAQAAENTAKLAKELEALKLAQAEKDRKAEEALRLAQEEAKRAREEAERQRQEAERQRQLRLAQEEEDKKEEEMRQAKLAKAKLVLASAMNVGRGSVQGFTITGEVEFPTFVLDHVALDSGKWYYEVLLHTGGIVQFGWAETKGFAPPGRGDGVGDDRVSWSYDGSRGQFFHAGGNKGPMVDAMARSKPGDVVGTSISFRGGAATIAFYLNGKHLGDKFFDVKVGSPVRPAVSVYQQQKVEVRFFAADQKFTPAGFSAVLSGAAPPQLEVISKPRGLGQIDGATTTGVENICTVAVKGRRQLTQGKWYYEARLLTAGAMRFGWAVPSRHAPNGLTALGDDQFSFGYDGKAKAFVAGGRTVGDGTLVAWKAGDVVGCAANLDGQTKSLSYFLNGRNLGEKHVGIAIYEGITPAASLDHDQACVWEFSSKHLKFCPEGFRGLQD